MTGQQDEEALARAVATVQAAGLRVVEDAPPEPVRIDLGDGPEDVTRMTVGELGLTATEGRSLRAVPDPPDAS